MRAATLKFNITLSNEYNDITVEQISISIIKVSAEHPYQQEEFKERTKKNFTLNPLLCILLYYASWIKLDAMTFITVNNW